MEEHIHTKLWKLVPWYLVRLGNHNGVAAVQSRCTHGGALQPRQGHALLGTQDSLGELPSLLAASRELCGAVATQKLGRTTEHVQPQASECRLEGAIPMREVESKIRPNTGSPPPGWVFFRGGENWALGQSQPWLHGV